jgi:predicted TIM-barrel fold metal-dependent hydrolase
VKYLDFHQHYGFMEYRATRVQSESPKEDFERIVIENCKRFDMRVAVNGCGIHPQKGLICMNNEVEEFAARFPDYIIPVGFIDLDYDTPAMVDDLYRRGFKGLKTIWPSKRYDSEDYFEVYKRCQFLELPVLFHTGICAIETFNGKKGACSYNMHPIFLEAVAMNFPKLQVVGAHLGTGNYATACALADASHYASNNLKFDISAADHYRGKIKSGGYIKRDIPVGSIIWGLDEPPVRYEEQITDWNNYFTQIGLSQDEKDQIFYKNACSVFGIIC